MRGNEKTFSAFTNSKFLRLEKCLTMTAVFALALTLNTATVTAEKIKTSFQNASRLNPTTTSTPSVTVDDFSRYIDSKSQSETVVIDISDIAKTSDGILEYYEDYYTENINEINTSQRPDNKNTVKTIPNNISIPNSSSPRTAALKKANKNVEREALIADGNYAYYTPRHNQWSPVDPAHHPFTPHPVLLPHPTPSPIIIHPPPTTTEDSTGHILHYTINYHEEPDPPEVVQHTFFVDEVVPPVHAHQYPAPVIDHPELVPLHHPKHPNYKHPPPPTTPSAYQAPQHHFPDPHHHPDPHQHHHPDPHHHQYPDPHHLDPHGYPLVHPVPIPQPHYGYPPKDSYGSHYKTTTTAKPDEPPRSYFPSPSIPGILEDEGASTLLKLLADVDLKDTISGDGPYTMFAPTNAAFAMLDPNLVTTLTQDKELLKSVLQYHLVPRKLYSKNFLDDTILATALEGNFLRMSKGPCGGATVNGAEINTKRLDQTASNGVVHFIDDVIYPIPSGSIIQILTKDKRFAALSDALLESDLAERLNSTSKSFTIFAPTDEAFGAVPSKTLKKLAEDKESMLNLLLKHVVKGTKVSLHLSNADLESLGKTTLQIRAKKGKVKVDTDANIIDGDIIATNGVIQVIDKVLLGSG